MKKLVFLFALVALVGFTTSAWAADASATPGPSTVLNGRIVVDLGYQSLTKELTTNKKDDVTSAFLNLSSSSYLRSSFTSADKSTGGVVELGASSVIGNSESMSLRFAYGWWQVGNCKLTAGQTDNLLGSLAYSPMQSLGSQQSTKENMRLWGYYYGGRNPQVNVQLVSGNLTFMVAAVQPSAEIALSRTGADTYANLPRFDVAAELKAGGLSLAPGFGWSQLKFQGVASGADDSSTQWIVMLPVKFTTGPFTAKFQAHTGANLDVEWSGQKLNAIRSAVPQGQPVFSAAGKAYDTKQTGGVLSVEYAVGDLTIAAGYGMEKLENDYWKQSNGYKNGDYTRNGWFVSFPYNVTKNFQFNPEVGYYNYGDAVTNGKDSGQEWLAGFTFKFVF